MNSLNSLLEYLGTAAITDLVDILIVAYLIYRMVRFVRDTSAERLVKGLFFLVVATQVANWLHLNTIYYMLDYIMRNALLVIIVIFQPELRRALEQVGKSKISSFIIQRDNKIDITETAILQTVEACSAMSWSRIGALIVFERHDRLGDIIKTGTIIDAEISAELVKNVFYPKAPLHDGAMIVRDGRIVSAGCVLPLSANQNLSKELGTRHRASVGMSEVADSVVVIVSEETGSISVAIGGMLKRHLAPETLEKLLKNELMAPTDEKNAEKSNILTKWKEKRK